MFLDALPLSYTGRMFLGLGLELGLELGALSVCNTGAI